MLFEDIELKTHSIHIYIIDGMLTGQQFELSPYSGVLDSDLPVDGRRHLSAHLRAHTHLGSPTRPVVRTGTPCPPRGGTQTAIGGSSCSG